MKKLIFLSAILTTAFAFSQVKVTPESKDLNEVYKGGDKQLVKDVQNNFSTFSSEYQVNGKFILNFDLDKNGKIIHPKVLPEVNNDFAYAVIRSFKRVKNNFNPNMPKSNLALVLDFNPSFKSDDGRERFTETAASDRFQMRNN
ncbi:hypothetical protein SAMN05421847_0838 [Halpernia humi]|uniref:TonB C-terminal domain-containing protein n=1 Tax=Halpernia humi TaxID=493375 RepID=A0A1H5UNC0_9FLAO|nr:hypothetical protein [Halpernia humi]SEF75931.1 hypothetical protein SAMN05421847_0838 [Halpernia humi]